MNCTFCCDVNTLFGSNVGRVTRQAGSQPKKGSSDLSSTESGIRFSVLQVLVHVKDLET